MPRQQDTALVDHDACGVGFVAQLGSTGTHDVVERALTALVRLSHRGGVDADGRSGDGAGLLTLIPRTLISDRAHEADIELPEAFGLGMVFLPRERSAQARAAIEASAQRMRLRCLGWRVVPTNPSILGPRALATLPRIEQCFIAASRPDLDFERQLFLLRKRAETEAVPGTYFCSLSSQTVVYKGLLAPWQLPIFYPELTSADYLSPFAVFHQRYSTNTHPTWSLAQPFRFVSHNGEINTIGANRRWLRARESSLRKSFQVGEWFRALEEAVSDSASFDNAFEILLERGYSAAAAMLRLVPPAWENSRMLVPELRQYLQAQAYDQEPWDGPAALAFSDGRMVGAKLDRNGLRPLRYLRTSDGLIVLGSEAGLADLGGKQVVERQRLGPGEMLLVDPPSGAVFRGKDLAELLGSPNKPCSVRPPSKLAPVPPAPAAETQHPRRVAAALGWTEDQFRLLFQPMGLEGKESVWSMGDDAPPAFISSARRPLWDYCKQRFAQVTNPPIDPLREAHVMSMDVHLGPTLVAGSPILDAGQLAALEGEALRPVRRMDLTFKLTLGVGGALGALERVRAQVADGVRGRPGMVLLSDRRVSANRAALPALLALAAAWKSMVQANAFEVPLVIESGQVIETHHVAMLIAAGATAVFPYLALELAESLKPGGAASYRAAVHAGLRKVIARMGISTLASYRNSHLFEIVGLDAALGAEFFEDATAVRGGKGLRELLEDSLVRHARAFAPDTPGLEDAGWYRFRQSGERHANSPELVRRLHRFLKSPTRQTYTDFAALANEREPVAVRDLLEIVPGTQVALDEVESESAILGRCSTQAMSLGALSPEAHRTLAIAMNRMGARSNTGEGGEDPDIYGLEPEAGNRIKQVASARFGVTAQYLVRAEELEIKMAQGSKPGEGGQLPAIKVTPYIARLRHAVPGMALLSPPPHHDIYSIEDLAQLVYDLRAVNPRARIGVKLVAGAGVGIIAAGVAKAGANVITICGFDGGTGASPLSSIKNTGLPWEVGLRESHCALVRAGLRGRVRLRVDGGFKFGRDVIIAALLGADEFGFGTAALLAVGCVMARQCHLNTCPTGVATQDETYRARFSGRPEMVMAYFRALAGEVRERLAAMGARSLGEIVGAVDRLRPRTQQAGGWLEPLLEPMPQSIEPVAEAREERTDLHRKLTELARGSHNLPVKFPALSIANSDRSVGAHLSGDLLRRLGPAGLDRSLQLEFRGTAGQSFGAFLISGLNFRLFGEANDYVGKGLSGGRVVITAGPEASRRGDVLVGNTVLYGATGGELYVAGRAGERFAVRNSGAAAVVEGLGQHGCEYMTGGIVVVLGPAGINFGSGMTGGLAYALEGAVPDDHYHPEFVRPAAIDADEEEWLRGVLKEHFRLTGSPRAEAVLRRSGPLPLVRFEPLHLPCSVAQSWATTWARLEKRDVPAVGLPDASGRESSVVVEGPRS